MGFKRCTSPFTYWSKDGVPRTVPGGELVDDRDPAIKGHEAFFEDVETYVSARSEARVEDATAAPGDKRDVTTTPRRGRPPKNKA